jgi:hypothetical protein
MGLFNLFKGDRGEKLTPHLIFATSLIYMMGADGEIDHEEVGHLLAVLGGESDGKTIGVGANNRELLDRAVKIARTTPLDKFIADAVPLLTDAQKMCIVLNLLDSSLADGTPEEEEQVLFNKMLRAFGISDERFRPFFEVMMIKNDRSVFINQNHPSNQPGFQVRLSM